MKQTQTKSHLEANDWELDGLGGTFKVLSNQDSYKLYK